MNEMKWVPGFIQLTRKAAGKISVQLDSVIIYEGMNRTGGTTIRVREFPDWIQVEESLEEISDLIRENWGMRVSGEAAMGAEYGTGDYKIGKDGWK